MKLGGISKRGDVYLRTLLIHGARVSLFVGLAASLFTAYFFTRLLFDLVYTRRRKVEALSI